MDLAVEAAEVAPKNDGDSGVVSEGGADDVVDVRGAGCREEEDAEGIERVVRSDLGEFFEARADGETKDLDFLGRNFLRNKSFSGVLVGNEKVVTGRSGPSGVDLDRVRDHGDDGDAAAAFQLSLHHVGVDRVGADDEVGLELVEEICHGVLGFGNKRERAGEVLLVGGTIEPRPNARGVGRDFTIGPAEKAVDTRVAEVAGVRDENLGIRLEGLGEVSGGAVVPVAKAGSEDEYFGLHTIDW